MLRVSRTKTCSITFGAPHQSDECQALKESSKKHTLRNFIKLMTSIVMLKALPSCFFFIRKKHTISLLSKRIKYQLYSACYKNFHKRVHIFSGPPSQHPLPPPLLAQGRLSWNLQRTVLLAAHWSDLLRCGSYKRCTLHSQTISCPQDLWIWNEPRHDKTNKMSVRPAKTQISLGIRPVWSVFAVRMKKIWVLSYPLSAQRRLWSDWADA